MFTFQEFSDFVESLTPTIRETVGKYIGKVHVDYKADDSPVTLADKEIERYIVSRIESLFKVIAIGRGLFGKGVQDTPGRLGIVARIGRQGRKIGPVRLRSIGRSGAFGTTGLSGIRSFTAGRTDRL